MRVCHKSNLKDAIRTIILELGLDISSWLIRLGLFDKPSSPARAKVVCGRSHDHFGCQVTDWSATISSPEALQVVMHSLQVALLVGFYPSAYYTATADRVSYYWRWKIRNIKIWQHLNSFVENLIMKIYLKLWNKTLCLSICLSLSASVGVCITFWFYIVWKLTIWFLWLQSLNSYPWEEFSWEALWFKIKSTDTTLWSKVEALITV